MACLHVPLQQSLREMVEGCSVWAGGMNIKGQSDHLGVQPLLGVPGTKTFAACPELCGLSPRAETSGLLVQLSMG